MKSNKQFVEEIVNECFNCGYHYQEEGGAFPCCHFDGVGLAPCEYEEAEDYYEDEDEVLSDFYDLD